MKLTKKQIEHAAVSAKRLKRESIYKQAKSSGVSRIWAFEEIRREARKYERRRIV
tara:strand:- start:5634 stop:5798 length:165 start_codon:yes stop_codon:yes gene_type:complete